MDLSKAELRLHAKMIRETLAPWMARDGGDPFDKVYEMLPVLSTLFNMLRKSIITVELIRGTRIEKALLEIVDFPAFWPLSMVKDAQNVLDIWSHQLGPLRGLRADHWGPEGRMAGIARKDGWKYRNIRITGDMSSQTPKRIKSPLAAWKIETNIDLSKPYKFGHNGFSVGE